MISQETAVSHSLHLTHADPPAGEHLLHFYLAKVSPPHKPQHKGCILYDLSDGGRSFRYLNPYST